jgi:hypothetical protein
MIVTRQRPKPRQVHKILLPIIALILLALVFILPPSRNLIMNGPLAPAWRVSGNFLGTALKPFHFAALNNEITNRDRTIAQLRAQINDQKTQLTGRDKQISALQSQINQMTQQSVTDRAKNVPKAAAAASDAGGAPGAAQTSGSDLAANATPDMHRVATQWAAMDAESAAKVVQKLPVPYVARVLALMPADAAGQILGALPASYAAALTQEHPELRP